MYDNYLWQPLNEMYYGKHPYFKTLENLFDQFRDFLKRHKVLLIEYEKEQEQKLRKQEQLILKRKKELLDRHEKLKKREEELDNRDRQLKKQNLYYPLSYNTSKISLITYNPFNIISELDLKDIKRFKNEFYIKSLTTSKKELDKLEDALNKGEDYLNKWENDMNNYENNNLPGASKKSKKLSMKELLYRMKSKNDSAQQTDSDKSTSENNLTAYKSKKRIIGYGHKNESFNNYNDHLWSGINENDSNLDLYIDYLNKQYCTKYNMEEFYTYFCTDIDRMNDVNNNVKINRKLYPTVKIDNPFEITEDNLNMVISAQLRSHGLFIPLNLEEAKEYDSITTMICTLFSKIFNFPNLKILVLCGAEKETAMFVNNMILDLLGEYNFSKDKSLEFKQWLNKQKVNKFVSDSMSIRFKTFPKRMKDTLICISDLSILSSKSDHIIAGLLHEIGHCFAFHLLPIEFSFNKTVQERFADAFAAKFGYGLELIHMLKHIQFNSLFNSFGENIRYRMKNNKDISTYKKSRLQLLIDIINEKKFPKSTSLFHAPDEHPSQIHRFKDILSHLYIELGNQRLSPIKKKELMNDINKIIKEIPKYGNDEYSKFMKDMDDMLYKSALAKYEMKKSDEYFNNYIMRNMLDYIYDNTIGK